MQKKHIKIKSIEEPYGKLILEDGSVHTFRLCVGAAYRIYEDSGQPQKHPEGGANYGFAPTIMFQTVEEPNDVKLSDWREEPVIDPKRKAN